MDNAGNMFRVFHFDARWAFRPGDNDQLTAFRRGSRSRDIAHTVPSCVHNLRMSTSPDLWLTTVPYTSIANSILPYCMEYITLSCCSFKCIDEEPHRNTYSRYFLRKGISFSELEHCWTDSALRGTANPCHLICIVEPLYVDLNGQSFWHKIFKVMTNHEKRQLNSSSL